MKLSLSALLVAALAGCGAKEPTAADTTTVTTPAPTAPAPDPKDPRAAILKEIPESLAADPTEVTEAVKAIAATLPTDGAGLARALATTPTITARPFPAPAPGAPRSADEVATALTAKTPIALAPFERALFMQAILASRGVKTEWGYVAGTRFAATELLARRFAIRLADGVWLSPEGGPLEGADAERVRPLDLVDLHAHDLAFRALGAISKEDADLASKAAGLARRLRPDDAAILFVAARAELLNRLVEAASETMRKAAAIESDAMTSYALGQQARLEERPFKADEHFRKAAQADPGFAAPHIGLAELALDRLDLTPSEQHPALIEQAKKAIADAAAADPKARGLRLVQAHLDALADDYAGAEAKLREETSLHPDHADAWSTLAQVQTVQGNTTAAIATLEGARKAGLETSEILTGLGALYVQTQDFQSARKALEGALAKDPEDPDLRPQIAQLLLQDGDTDGAKKLLEAQIAKFPESTQGELLLAQVELETGRIDEALAHVATVLAKDPQQREARILAFVGRVATGKPADEFLPGAIEAAGSRKNLAQLMFQNGLAREAEPILAGALESEKDDVVVPVMLAAIYIATGRQAEAEALREKTLAPLTGADKDELAKLFEEAFAQAAKVAAPPGHPEGDPESQGNP